ncbi:MAG: SH3 domain-containing protein [Lachnospiraceae bacterium]|nr:SH3 domain-containing protein [Lachnospiraceae bacterium]
MIKDKFQLVRDYLIKKYKIILPVGVILAVAVTVSIALAASGDRKIEDIVPSDIATQESIASTVEEVPLTENGDDAIRELILTFYNAQAVGDLDTIKALCDEVSELDLLSFQEKANYIEYFPEIVIYTKKGMNEGESIVYVYYKMTFVNHDEEFPGYTSYYVCTAEDGSLYIKRSNFSDELNEYISTICVQDDVVEFNNRITAEYDDFFKEHPDLEGYAEEVMAQVNMNVGVKWSKMQEEAAAREAANAAGNDADEPEVVDGPIASEEEAVYAYALDTVNVRVSDSEKADKLGKAAKGSKWQVLEERVNGWTKIDYEGQDGYIRSDFLRVQENASGQTTIGEVKAKTNINVRAAASETAEKLGVLAGGDTAELIADEGDWCKIKYSGKVGYVKGEYVER